MKKEFLDLGRQPIANKFLKEDEISDEFFFDLRVVFDEETKLVSMKDFVKPELMFNEDYKYNTSLSTPMVNHFKQTAEALKMKFQPKKVLEIGSNDGAFICNFPQENSMLIFSGFLIHEISCLTHHYANKLRLSINLKFSPTKQLEDDNVIINEMDLS